MEMTEPEAKMDRDAPVWSVVLLWDFPLPASFTALAVNERSQDSIDVSSGVPGFCYHSNEVGNIYIRYCDVDGRLPREVSLRVLDTFARKQHTYESRMATCRSIEACCWKQRVVRWWNRQWVG